MKDIIKIQKNFGDLKWIIIEHKNKKKFIFGRTPQHLNLLEQFNNIKVLSAGIYDEYEGNIELSGGSTHFNKIANDNILHFFPGSTKEPARIENGRDYIYILKEEYKKIFKE